MACGCVAVTGKYGTEDYLIDNQNGIIINPFNENEAVGKIISLTNDREKMFTYCVEGKKTADGFVWDNQTNKLNNFIMNVPKHTHLNIPAIQQGDLNEFEKKEKK
jgi:glycosyltransferase involved in cell wall biosynthesis